MTEQHPEPVKIGEYASEIEAAIEKTALEAEGIRVWTTGELTSGMRAEAPGRVRLFVQEQDAERATKLLESFRDGGDSTGA